MRMKDLLSNCSSVHSLLRMSAILLTGLIVIGLVVALAQGETRNTAPAPPATDAVRSHFGAFSTTANPQPSANSTECNLLNSTYVPPVIQQNVTVTFAKVCKLPQFVALVETWGAKNFTVYYGLANGSYTGAYYTESWVSNCSGASFSPSITLCVHEEYWAGNLANNFVSGPFNEVYPATSAGPPLVASSPVSGLTPWLIITVAVVAVAAAAAALVVTSARRRAALNEAMLLAPEVTASSVSPPPGGAAPSAPNTQALVSTARSEPTDTLEDLF